MGCQEMTYSALLNTPSDKLKSTRFTVRSNNINDSIPFEILQKIPSIVNDRHTGSDRYNQVQTYELLHDLADFGWYPIQVSQCATFKGKTVLNASNLPEKISADSAYWNRVGCQKHMVVLANKEHAETLGTRPLMGIVNASDKSAALNLSVGFKVFACDNTAFSCSNDYSCNGKYSHSHGVYDWIKFQLEKIDITVKSNQEVINTMQNSALDYSKQIDMAKTMTDTIRPELECTNFAKLYHNLVTDRLNTQSKSNTWDTYQTLQRHLLQGSFTYESTRQTRNGSKLVEVKARKITGPKTIELNRDMWSIATQYVQ